MKYAIISDIHGNLEALQSVLMDIKSLNIESTVCLGDIVGYGPNPHECVEIIRSLEIPCVKGNHDEYATDSSSPALTNAKGLEWTRKQLTAEDRAWLRGLPYTKRIANFTIVHASLNTPPRWEYVFDTLVAAASFAYQDSSLCFFGHTHIPAAFVRDTVVRGGSYSKFQVQPGKQYFVSPGSVGQPRDNNPKAAYAIYDRDAGTIELRRVDYDIEKTRQKMRAAGL